MIRRCGLSFIAFSLLAAGIAWACNVPVFRYALERWKPDTSEVIVFHEAPLDNAQNLAIERLRNAASGPTGAARANLSVVLSNVGSGQQPADERELWSTVSAVAQGKLPWVVVRTRVNDKHSVYAWQGALDTLNPDRLLDSPVRQELSRRLLGGHSVVWLLVKAKHADRNQRVRSLLDAQLKKLSRTVPFPEGLGLPGSELYSEVPLLMQFTVLEIDPADPAEEYLVKLFRGFDPEAVRADQPLVVPVFGRGRALEVIPANRLDEGMIGDLTRYLCGACSCQVKERNPGFDLLLTSDWDRQLFGEDGQLPPPPKEYDPDTAPSYVPIP